MPATTANAAAASTEKRPWDPSPDRSAELIKLEAAMQRNRARLLRLRQKYPCVWHMGYTLEDYDEWIVSLTRIPAPTIYDLTVVCLAVRAATDSAEFDWRTRPESKELENQISNLALAVHQASLYVAGRRGLSKKDEDIRSVYEKHIRSNLAILMNLIDTKLARTERGVYASKLREGLVTD